MRVFNVESRTLHRLEHALNLPAQLVRCHGLLRFVVRYDNLQFGFSFFLLCTKIDNIIIDTVLTYDGVNERTIEPNVFLYPNLASSYVTIYVQDQNVRLTEVELFDINGRRLRTMSAVASNYVFLSIISQMGCIS